MDYNAIMQDFEALCEEKGCCNAFKYASVADLEQLNYLLDRVLLFCEENEETLEDLEFGDKILELAQLADALFTKDC